MKKIFTILAVLGALTFIAVPAQALMGMPDDQPGKNFKWWFLTSMSGGLNTLLVVYEVGNSSATFDYTIYTRSSVSVANGSTTLTAYDMDSFDGYTFAQNMAPVQAAKLEIDLDGDATNDHWFGYIGFVQGVSQNNILAKTMLLNLPAGQYAETNVHANEWNNSGNMYAGIRDGNNVELFSANAKANAKAMQILAGAQTATSFNLYPRYYVNSSSGKSYLIVWKSTNAPTADLHLDWYDNDENTYSSNLPLPYELNIVDLDAGYIPQSLWPAGTYPKEGWINIALPDKNGAGFVAATEWEAWTWTLDTGAAAESWSGLSPVPRDANY